MIELKELTKRFGGTAALDGLTAAIPTGAIYGLVGSNGAGKSTLLRLLAGVYRPDAGTALLDGLPLWENPAAKQRVFFVADDPYFLPGSSLDDMAGFYAGLYPGWSRDDYRRLCETFPIPAGNKLSAFSKGMKRQAALLLALAARPDVLLMDEAFDGLDPVIRGLLRRLLADAAAERGITVLIASHNLRELEDLCDHVGVLHAGRLLFQREIDELKLGYHKVQCAFAEPPGRAAFEALRPMRFETRGCLVTLVARGGREELLERLNALSPVFLEAVPLTLEEVFIQEMEAVGYDCDNILF